MWQLETRFARINDVAHFSLLMGTNTYILQTHTQRLYYEVQVVFWVILRSTPLQYTKFTPGKGGYVVFWEKYEVLRPAPLPPKTGYPQACPTRVVVRTKSPTVEDRHRQEHAARKNSRATTAVLALRDSFRTDTY